VKGRVDDIDALTEPAVLLGNTDHFFIDGEWIGPVPDATQDSFHRSTGVLRNLKGVRALH
jgi:uncharacterized membrane protein